jgi:hypothetical protein
VTVVGDPFVDYAHQEHTSTPKPSTAFGLFKPAVSTMKQPDRKVCCHQYAVQTGNAMKKEWRRETMWIAHVTIYVRMEVRYEWNVQKGRPSMSGREYATHLKMLDVTVARS